MDKIEYIKKINNNLLSCWLTIDLVLFFAYVIEYLKGTRTFEYVVTFTIVTFLPLVIAFIFILITNGTNAKVKYIAGIGYCIFYTFVIFTTQSNAAFVYIIPMISILVVYNDTFVIGFTYGYALLINIIYVAIKVIQGQNSTELITLYEIQLACIALSALFLIKATNIVQYGNNKLFELSEEIYKDPLTNSYNRTFLTENINQIFKVNNKKHGISLAFIDIDNFKRYNTQYGHDFGDKVLINLCEIINERIQYFNKTYLVRVGGDEFVLISNDLDQDRLVKLMQDIINYVNKIPISDNIHIGLSIGIANTYRDKCEDYLDLYKLADKRLYESKEKGKNQVTA